MAQLRFGVVTRGLVTSVEVGGDPLEDEVRVVTQHGGCDVEDSPAVSLEMSGAHHGVFVAIDGAVDGATVNLYGEFLSVEGLVKVIDAVSGVDFVVGFVAGDAGDSEQSCHVKFGDGPGVEGDIGQGLVDLGFGVSAGEAFSGCTTGTR